MLIFTCAIVWIGTTITSAKSIVPKNNFFIFSPSILVSSPSLALPVHTEYLMFYGVMVDLYHINSYCKGPANNRIKGRGSGFIL